MFKAHDPIISKRIPRGREYYSSLIPREVLGIISLYLWPKYDTYTRYNRGICYVRGHIVDLYSETVLSASDLINHRFGKRVSNIGSMFPQLNEFWLSSNTLSMLTPEFLAALREVKNSLTNDELLVMEARLNRFGLYSYGEYLLWVNRGKLHIFDREHLVQRYEFERSVIDVYICRYCFYVMTFRAIGAVLYKIDSINGGFRAVEQARYGSDVKHFVFDYKREELLYVLDGPLMLRGDHIVAELRTLSSICCMMLTDELLVGMYDASVGHINYFVVS